MTVSLEHEAAKVLRESEALFNLPCLTWFEDSLSTFDCLNTLDALEHLLRQTLNDGSEFNRSQGFEEDSPSDRPKGDPGLWSRASLHPSQHQRRKEFPERHADSSIPEPDVSAAAASSSIPTHTITETLRGTISGKSASISRTGTSPQGTRLVTELPDLQNLFHSVVAHGNPEAESPEASLLHAFTPSTSTQLPQRSHQNEIEKPRTEVADRRQPPSDSALMANPVPEPHRQPWMRQTERIGSDALASVPATLAKEGSGPDTDGHASMPSWPEFNTVAHSSAPSHTEGPEAEISSHRSIPSQIFHPATSTQTQTFAPESAHPEEHPRTVTPGPETAVTWPSSIPDPAWEDLLFDRLLDRWEERLREQSIRHLGFTGGQI